MVETGDMRRWRQGLNKGSIWGKSGFLINSHKIKHVAGPGSPGTHCPSLTLVDTEVGTACSSAHVPILESEETGQVATGAASL